MHVFFETNRKKKMTLEHERSSRSLLVKLELFQEIESGRVFSVASKSGNGVSLCQKKYAIYENLSTL